MNSYYDDNDNHIFQNIRYNPHNNTNNPYFYPKFTQEDYSNNDNEYTRQNNSSNFRNNSNFFRNTGNSDTNNSKCQNNNKDDSFTSNFVSGIHKLTDIYEAGKSLYDMIYK